jgi:hypothetical protein
LIEQLYQQLDSAKVFEEIVMSENETQFEELWKIRELVGTASGKVGITLKYDVTLN